MNRLQAARADARTHLEALRASHAELVAAVDGANADDEHDPEGATLAFERQQLAALLEQAEASFAEAEAALARRAAGGYGTCERCGGAIGGERLEALPATRLCITCARAR